MMISLKHGWPFDDIKSLLLFINKFDVMQNIPYEFCNIEVASFYPFGKMSKGCLPPNENWTIACTSSSYGLSVHMNYLSLMILWPCHIHKCILLLHLLFTGQLMNVMVPVTLLGSLCVTVPCGKALSIFATNIVDVLLLKIARWYHKNSNLKISDFVLMLLFQQSNVYTLS